jgi:hypothetical protein
MITRQAVSDSLTCCAEHPSVASMNTAASLGPARVLNDWTSWWAYLGGPAAGAVIAVGIAYVLRGRGGGLSGVHAAQGPLGTGWRPGPRRTLSPAGPAQAAWQRGEWAVAAKSDASDGAAASRPSTAPARAVVLTSLIQLVAVAMNLRLRHRRSLRAIERNLADSDPSLAKLFSAFTVRTQGEERGQAENVEARSLRALARRLATGVRHYCQ